MNFSKIMLFTAFTISVFSSCTNDADVPAAPQPLGAYDNGVLILNQGNFGTANSSISYLSDNFSTFQNDVFHIVNPTEILGDTAQDIGLSGNLAYIIVNGSNKIEIVNRYTLQHIGAITTGLSNPRYIAFANDKAYVTNWGVAAVTTDDYVAVINLTTNAITSTIPVAEGPDRILAKNGNLYVAHLGGYGFGTTISAIDGTTNVVTPITVGDVPNSLVISGNDLFVISGGKPSWSGTETAGKLTKINTVSNTVTTTLDFGTTVHPSNLVLSGTNLYYTVDEKVYTIPTTATALPTTTLFSAASQGVTSIYSFEVRNNKIFVGDAGNYSANGKVYVHSMTGTLEQTYTVGVTPAGFYFN
jgi:hypothetical protein